MLALNLYRLLILPGILIALLLRVFLSSLILIKKVVYGVTALDALDVVAKVLIDLDGVTITGYLLKIINLSGGVELLLRVYVEFNFW